MRKGILRKIMPVLILVLISSSLAVAQMNSQAMLKEAMDLKDKAVSAAANIFAPSEFKKAFSAFKDAEEYAADPAKIEKMNENLVVAITNFKTAIEKANAISPNFQALLKMRGLVTGIGVDLAKNKSWIDAEDYFVSAVEDFLDKDPEGVKKYSDRAEKNYRDAELIAIKDKYQTVLLKAIETAKDNDVHKFAPLTINKVAQYAKDIEGIIDLNRYDTLKAGAILNSANYELRHASYMQGIFSNMKKEDKTFEDLELVWEEPLARVGAEFKLQRAFDTGFDNYTNSIIQNIGLERAKIDTLKKNNETLTATIADLKKNIETAKVLTGEDKKQIAKLTAQADSLKKVYSELKKTTDEYKAKLNVLENEQSAQKAQKVAEAVNSISELFSIQEAEIARSGDSVIIRLISLTFPQKGGPMESKNHPILNKVQKAIQAFPNAAVTIAGHIDPQENDAKSIELSKTHADAVQQYLISVMGDEAKNFTTIGWGSSKPLADNTTDKGKMKNRRIEIIINPVQIKK